MFIIVYSSSMMNINAHTYSLHLILYSYILELYLYLLMLYSCIFMFSNSYISHFETNMVLCHRHHALPKKAKRQSFANAQQHAAALWKACSAGEASLAWQKALGVRTLSSVIDMAKLALAGGVVGGMHGSAGTRPKRCEEGIRPALQGSHVVVVEFGGENEGLVVATARQLLGHVVRYAGTVVNESNRNRGRLVAWAGEGG